MLVSSHALKQGIFLLAVFLSFSGAGLASPARLHTIAGTVFDAARAPMADIQVELLDNFGRMMNNGRQRTDGSGRFQFQVATDGRYTIRVFAFRYDYEDQSQDIDIAAVTALPGEAGSSYNNYDFYLQPKKGGLIEAELAVVFAQSITPEAKKAYESAVKDLATKREAEGMAGLKKAVELMPDYFVALNRLGKELFVRGKFQDAVPVLLKAGEVNQKSSTSFYYLGSSLMQLGPQYYAAAAASLSHAAVLAPASPQVHYMLGKALKTQGMYLDAEKALVKAKKLSTTDVPEIHKELAQLYADNLKRYDAAADELEAYIKASKQKGPDMENTKKVVASLRAKAKSNPGN